MNFKKIINCNWITILVILTGTVFLILGIWRKEYTIVMEKAINICLECIGIG